MRSILSVLVFSSMSQMAFSQLDSIVLLNGKVYRGEVKKVEAGILTYTETKKDGSIESFEITTDRLFSYIDEGKETVFYVENEFTGDFLSVESARRATLGSYDARQTLKPRFVFYSSLLVGYGVSCLDTYYSQKAYNNFLDANGGVPPVNAQVGFFGAKPTLMPILVPMVLSGSWAIPSFRIKPKQLLQKYLYGDEQYYRGFNRVARQKRVLAALKGSVIGVGLGYISYFAFTPN
jgi:hypothetical protein